MNGLALCAGGGGLELGLQLALGDAYRTVCYVEREAYAAAVLTARMEDGRLDPAPVWDELVTFDGQRWRGHVDLISAGFPCTPWSAAGLGKGTDDERWIWPDIVRVVREVAPRLVFLENVPPLVTRGGLRLVLADLAELGFDAEWGLLRASDVGAPHRRERLFILAHTSGTGWRLEAGADEAGLECVGEQGGSGLGERSGDALGRSQLFGDGLGDPASTRAVAQVSRSRSRRPAGKPGGSLADTGRVTLRIQPERDQRPARSEPEAEREHAGSGAAVSVFPPGPGDTAGWATVLADRPELAPALEPAVRGDSDGMARALEFRTSRLRLLGNGVVPLQATAAFRVLWDRLMC